MTISVNTDGENILMQIKLNNGEVIDLSMSQGDASSMARAINYHVAALVVQKSASKRGSDANNDNKSFDTFMSELTSVLSNLNRNAGNSNDG